MVPIRTAVHIQIAVYLAVLKEGKNLKDFSDVLNPSAMLDQLVWWTNALKTAREQDRSQKAAA
jgi:hypothetical protein